MIVKVQRALSSGEVAPPALIYDQTRQHQWFVQLSQKEVQALLGSDAKGYFEATVSDRGKPILGTRVADQPW